MGQRHLNHAEIFSESRSYAYSIKSFRYHEKISCCFYSRRSTSFPDVILHAVNRFARINTVKCNLRFEPVSFNVVCT